jgi:hypothetical protein
MTENSRHAHIMPPLMPSSAYIPLAKNAYANEPAKAEADIRVVDTFEKIICERAQITNIGVKVGE